MNMTDMKCDNCGATLKVYLPYQRATCEYCGCNYYLDMPTTPTGIPPQNKDNPVDIRFVRDESDKPLHIFNEMRYIDWAKKYICFVSALAFILKKSYVLEQTEIGGQEYPLGDLWDNYAFNERQLRKLIKALERSQYDHADDIQRFTDLPKDREEQARKNTQSMEHLRNTLRECGLEAKEKATSVTNIINNGGKYGSVKQSFDQHSFTIADTIITPEYFQTHFGDVYAKYLKVKNREETQEIASQLAKAVNICNCSVVSGLRFIFELGARSCHLTVGSFRVFEINESIDQHVMFNSFGMADLDLNDFTTYTAVGIAILDNIINNTKKDGKYVLDTKPIDKDISWKIDNVIRGASHSFALPLDYIINSVKVYNQW